MIPWLVATLACGLGTPEAPSGTQVEEAAGEAPSPLVAGLAVSGALGEGHVVRLQPVGESLRLTVADRQGHMLPAEGEARIVLTGTGQEPQSLVLKAEGPAWVGPIGELDAPGYVAEVEVEVGGEAQVGRIEWGRVAHVEEEEE